MAQLRSYTTIEQSKKLAEILPIESADMEYLAIKENGGLVGSVPFAKDDSEVEDSAYSHIYDRIACWSLAALLEYLRKHDLFPEIKDADDYILMDITFYDEDEVVGESINPVHFIRAEGKNILDACYEMIIKLKAQNLI